MASCRRLANLFRRTRLENEIDRELSFHLAERVDDLVASGMRPEDARRTAARQFGNYTLQKERTREMDVMVLGNLWRDIRYGLRQLRRTPAFTLVAVLSLGIGTGANITVFGFVSALVFTKLPVEEPGRLIRVMGEGGNTALALQTQSDAHIRAQDYFRYREQNQAFSALAAQFIGGPMRVRTEGPARVIPMMLVSANYFETLGVPAAMGRVLMSPDGKPGSGEVIVLSDVGWRRFFDRDPGIVGKTAFINGRPATIVGVAPAWFTGTNAPMVPQIYAPIVEAPATTYRVDLIGRLNPGVSPSQAAADLSRIAAQLTSEDRQYRGIEVYPATVVGALMWRGIATVSALFALIVGVVLLIACDNIAILLLTRAAGRRQEIGIRLALGAGRRQLLVQLLAESFLLCVGGGLVGLSVAHVTAKFLTQFYAPVPMPFALTYDFDWRVGAFAGAVSCAAALLCGLAPALQSLKTDVIRTLRGSGLVDGARVRSSLIVTQVTLSTALLVTAAVLVRSLMSPVAPDSGFVSRGVLMSTIGLDERDTPGQRSALIHNMLERLGSVPGVSSVTAVDNIPVSNNRITPREEMRSDGRTGPVYANAVAPAFFGTLGIPLVAGRDFTAADDTTTSPVAIVNETLAQRFWPGENAIGKRLQAADGSAIEVVGLARDSKYQSLQEEPTAFMYRSINQSLVPAPTFLIKATGNPAATFSLVRARIAETDPDLAAYNVMTFDDRLGLGRIANRAAATVSGAMGLLALVLSAMGIYGTMSFLVQQRKREIGVRIALGASRWNVMSLVAGQGMTWTAIGLAVGLTGGLVAALLLRRVVHGVVVADPMAFVLTPLILGAAAYFACYVPARRATRLDPLVALREE